MAVFLSHSGDETSEHDGDLQKLDLRESALHEPKIGIVEEKLECDVPSLTPSAPPSLALAHLLGVNHIMLNINSVERTDADSEVTYEGPLWTSLEKKGARVLSEGTSPGEKEANLDGR